MTTTTTTPRVAITCLASYNAGRLIFEWVEASDLDEMQEAQARVAARAVAAAKEAGEYPVYFSEPEEFFLSDYEGFGDAIGEYTPLEKVAALAEAIEERGPAFLAFLSIDDGDGEVDELVERFEERYAGEWDSFREFCEDLVSQIGLAGVPPGKIKISEWPRVEVDPIEELSPYFDWDAVERSFEGDYTEVDGFVFRAWS